MNKNDKQSVNELELEQRKLNNLQMATSMKSQEFRMACDKIEQARRNVEVLCKVACESCGVRTKVDELILLNLEILKNTKKL